MLFKHHRIRLSIQNRQTYFRIIIFFISISISILTISTFTLYNLFARSAYKEIGTNVRTLLEQRTESTSFIMDWTLNYALKWSQDTEITSFALQDYQDSLQNYHIYKKMLEIHINNPFLESIYVINGYTQLVADNKNGISSKSQFYDHQIWSYLENWNYPLMMKLVPRKLSTHFNGQPYETHIFSIILPYEVNKSLSAFVMNIDVDKLQKFLGQNLNISEDKIFLVDEKNQVLSASDRSLFLQPFPFKEVIQQTPNDQNSGWFESKSNGHKQLVVYANTFSQRTPGWKIIEVIPNQAIFSSVHTMRNITYALYIFIFLLALFSIWRLSKQIYSPIEELIRDVKQNYLNPGNELNKEGSNEVSLLSRALKWQSSQIEKLTSSWHSNRILAREALLKELLHGAGSYSVNQVHRLFLEHNLQITPESLVVIVLRIDHYADFSQKNNVFHQKLLRFAISNVVTETMGAVCKTESVDMGGDHVCMLCNIEEGNTELLLPGLRKCQENIDQYLSISLTLGVSFFVEQYAELPDAYKFAFELTNERFKLGLGHIIQTSSVGIEPEYVYPEELEKKVMLEFKLGHETETFSQFEVFYRKIMNYSHSEIRLAVTQFLMNFGKVLQPLHVKTDTVFPRSLTHIQAQMDRLETAEIVREWFLDILSQLFAYLREQKKPRNTKLTQEITEIIQQRLSDPNLSSKWIADHLGMAVNYIRPLFKEENGQSISDYITFHRFEKVKELLTRTDLSLEEICSQTGFASINSFYVMFKKRFNITPNQFRRENKN